MFSKVLYKIKRRRNRVKRRMNKDGVQWKRLKILERKNRFRDNTLANDISNLILRTKERDILLHKLIIIQQRAQLKLARNETSL